MAFVPLLNPMLSKCKPGDCLNDLTRLDGTLFTEGDVWFANAGTKWDIEAGEPCAKLQFAKPLSRVQKINCQSWHVMICEFDCTYGE